MTRRMNFQALLECTCFVLFSALLLYLTLSGKYLSYVTPKMAPYLYFTSAVMLVWSMVRYLDISQPKYRIHGAHCLVLMIPILFLLLPHGTVSASGMSSGFMGSSNLSGLSGIGTGKTGAAAPALQNDGDSGTGTNPGTSQDGTAVQPAPAEESDQGYDDSLIIRYSLNRSEDGSIQVSDQMFYPWLSELFTNMQRYEGVSITMKGFVYKDSETMAENEFIPARFLMYCCSADMIPCGIVCQYDGAAGLEEDTWITVTGTIHIGQYEGEDEPQITVESIAPAEKPREEYVYPW